MPQSFTDKHEFGRAPDRQKAYLYTISNSQGMTARISDFGGIIQSLMVQDRQGAPVDIVQGFDSAEAYHDNPKFIGAVVGRYSNVIRGGVFQLNGQTYCLNKNYGEHCVHGGANGFYSAVWNAKPLGPNALYLSYLSPDREEGFPGNLLTGVCYSIAEDNALEIEYNAICDADTIISLTHHTYFNLCGHANESIAGHLLQVDADYYTEVDAEIIATGVISKVEGTAFDFNKEKPVTEDIESAEQQIRFGMGYDHNYVLNGEGLRKIASLRHPMTGIHMEVCTTAPGMQLYTDNDSTPVMGKGGALYNGRKGICLETQRFPNSPHFKHFPPAVLRRGDVYVSKTIYRFSTI